MLTLTRPHRQLLATAAVVLLMVVPTAIVAVSTWRLHRPEYLHQVERELGRTLGLSVRIAGVSYPRPGVAVFEGVVLHAEAPEKKSAPRAELLRAEQLRVSRDGRQLTLQADGLHLNASGPRQAMAQVATLLQRAGQEPLQPVGLIARTCVVHLGDGLDYSLRDLAGTIEVRDRVPTVTASYRVVDGSTAPRCELTLRRDRTGAAARTVLTLRTTEGASLPAQVLNPFFDSSRWIGSDARVAGTLVLEQPGNGDCRVQYQGLLDDLDLATLMARVAPGQRLTGRARLDIENAVWAPQGSRGPGWVESRGRLSVAGGGVIGAELLGALRSQVRFRVSDPWDPARPDTVFDALGLAFHITPAGELLLSGGLGSEHLPEAVIVQGQRSAPLAYAPEGASTITGLVRTLAPGFENQPDQLIPARFESLLIQQALPTLAPADPGSARAN